MNSVSLTGRIANNLEIRRTQTNKSVLEISLAVNRDRKDQNGEYPADFIKVYCWEQRAEYLNNYAQKGTLIGVSGRIETSSYLDRNGNKIYQTYITANNVEILKQPESRKQPEEVVQDQHTVTTNDNIYDNFGGNSYGYSLDDLPFM